MAQNNAICSVCKPDIIKAKNGLCISRISYGTFNKITAAKIPVGESHEVTHNLRVCSVCGFGDCGKHFNEKLFIAGGFLCIICEEKEDPVNTTGKTKLLYCKDVVDVIPHAFCFERDYSEITKQIQYYDETNTYCDGTIAPFVTCKDSFIIISRHSTCFEQVIDILSNMPVKCPHCNMYYDFPPSLPAVLDESSRCHHPN